MEAQAAAKARKPQPAPPNAASGSGSGSPRRPRRGERQHAIGHSAGAGKGALLLPFYRGA